ncbi:hypothetical protein RhiirA1_476377 [Rhizophagus irregularis]|uniref:Uncharacterized protein n=1 Tax=Rhizophagus irregularis TaxID=588596 RepID=A0A2N0QV81_9GLOM|nr:hypothetical protein RhiirA1_476377 [Rhizophagus irregularis]
MSSVSISPRNYQIGVCFICQLCMYCGINLSFDNCNCNKDIKPIKNNHSKVVYFRNLIYKPEQVHEKTKNTLLHSNQTYGYKLDMKLPHNFTLCSACNSQINRDVKAAEKEQKNIIVISLSPTDDTSFQQLQIEFRLRLSIKKNKQLFPSIIISFTLEDPNFVNFRNKLEMYICEQVGLIYQNEYNLAYKSSTESGAGTLLDNEDAFSEFIKDYQTMILGNKKVMVIVTLKELSKKHSHQNEVSEQEESNDELENRTHFHQKTKSLPKKRAKNHIPKESNLDENEMLVGSYVIKLNDNLWAKEIVNKNADLDIPPNHALFSMMHSVKVTRKSSLSDEFTQISRSLSLTSDHSLLSQISDYNLPKKVALNMKDFIGGLDKEFGDDKFTCYLPIFEEQEIRVSHLITLSDSEYILMDVTIIGRRQTLRNEAKKYE